MKTTQPQPNAAMYAACVTLIARGLRETISAEESVAQVKDGMDAAAFLLSLLDKAVKP